ncbi:toll/interleukin-1 receptor domain-containing protein [Streptomyces sp. NPDC006208]|uniref:toll/interleukin-1 receptor domain-containing protein n=1 Tax=Streptomyces sp. NPDC006208 TaxID=3156734 RepID=UPI0033A30352
MVRPRLFLSHSSPCTPQQGCTCRHHLDALEAHVKELGCDPVVDKRVLSGGNDWNSELLKEIKHCHGMIILLSPHALSSYHVMEEAIVAAAERAGSDEAFLILPVTLPGVRRSELPASMLGKQNLGRFDMIDWKTGPGVPSAKIARTLRPLVERLGGLPYPQVTDFIAGRISEVSDAALERTAEILGVATLAYARDHSRYVVAQGLLTERPVHRLGESCAMRLALKNFLPQVRTKEHREEIVDLVVPFARVPKQAADQLRRLGCAPGERVAFLQSALNETPDMYVRRASEVPEPWVLRKPVPRQDGSGFIDGLIAEIRDVLASEVAMGFGCDEVEMRELLLQHEEESGPFTIVLHQAPDPELIHRLLGEFPRLLFVFAHPQAGDGRRSDRAMFLETLTPSQEKDMVMTHRKYRR